MYALVLNESRILKWEGRKKERRTKTTKKKRREKDEFNEEEKSKKQKQRWTHREANKTKTSEVKNKQQSPAHSLSVSPDTSLSDIQVYTPRTTSHTVCATMLAEAGPQYLPLTSLSQRQKHPSMHPSMQQSVEKRKCESEYKTHKHAMKRTSLVTFKEREQNPRVKFPDCCPLVITVKQ